MVSNDLQILLFTVHAQGTHLRTPPDAANEFERIPPLDGHRYIGATRAAQGVRAMLFFSPMSSLLQLVMTGVRILTEA